MLSWRAPNCIHQILPSRCLPICILETVIYDLCIIESLGFPAMSNTAWATHFAAIRLKFNNFRLDVQDVVEDIGGNMIVMRASATASGESGLYRSEYILVLWLSAEEDLVEDVLEFVDSDISTEFWSKLMEGINSNDCSIKSLDRDGLELVKGSILVQYPEPLEYEATMNDKSMAFQN